MEASPAVQLTVSSQRVRLQLKSLVVFASLAYLWRRGLFSANSWTLVRSLLNRVIDWSPWLRRDPFMRLAETSDAMSLGGRYSMGQQIAIGTYGQVFECCQKGSTKKEFFVKVVPKDRHPLIKSAATSQARGAFGRRLASSPAVTEEESPDFRKFMNALQSLKHEQVVKYVQFFADRTSFYFVMERCPGIELLEDVTRKNEWYEGDARLLTKQMFEALSYIHGRGIMHRDVKLENIIVHRQPTGRGDIRQSLVSLKLIDFGLGCVVGGMASVGLAGTPGFAAPEVYGRGSYTEVVDVFSVGVVLYILFTGRPPFRAPMNMQNISAHVQSLFDGPDLRSAPFPFISKLGQELLDMILLPNPSVRYSAAEALKHPWFRKGPQRSKFVLWRSSSSEVQFLKVMGVWEGSSKSSQFSQSLSAPLEQISECDTGDSDQKQSIILEALCVSLVRHMSIAVCIADPNEDDCPLLAVSHGFTQLTGFSNKQCVGKNCRFLNTKRGEMSQEFRQGLRRAVEEETTFLGVLPNSRADGTSFNNLLHLSPLDLGSKTYMVGVQMEVEDESSILKGPRRDASLAVVRKAHSALHHWVRCSQGGVGSKKLVVRKDSE